MSPSARRELLRARLAQMLRRFPDAQSEIELLRSLLRIDGDAGADPGDIERAIAMCDGYEKGRSLDP